MPRIFNADEYGDKKRIPKIVRSIGDIMEVIEEGNTRIENASVAENEYDAQMIAYYTGAQMMYDWLVGKSNEEPKW